MGTDLDLFVEQSKTAGEKAILRVLELQRGIDAINESLGQVSEKLLDDKTSLEALSELRTQNSTLSAKKARLEVAKAAEESKLGLSDQAELDKLRKDEFVNCRVNAYALVSRIRSRMIDRRFEMDRLERSYRTTVNGNTTSYFGDYQTLTTHYI